MPSTLYQNVELGTWGLGDIIVGDNTIEVVFKVFWKLHDMVVQFDPKFTTEGFLRNWQQRVSDQWDGRFEFTQAAEPKKARSVQFRIQSVDELSSAHMPVYILSGNYAANAGVCFPTPNFFGGDRIYLRLNSGDNRTYAVGQAENIASGTVVAFKDGFNNEINRVKGAVSRVVNGNGKLEVTLNRNGNAWSVADDNKPKLKLLCGALAASPPYYPQPVVKLTVTSGLTEKGQALAACVTNFMHAEGVHVPTIVNNVIKTSRKFHAPFSGHKPTAQVQLELLDAGAMYRNVRSGIAMADYCVSAHEFGHLFGLPDEYLDYSGFKNEAMRTSQPFWDSLCDAHEPKIAKRKWKSAFNESVMSVGNQVYKCHAVTLWDAVQRVTNESWTITKPG